MNEIQFRYQSQIRDTISLQTCKQCMFDDVWNEYYTTWKGTLRFLVTCRKQIVFNCQFLVKIICLNACLSRILNRHVKCKYHNCGFRPWKGRIIIETFSWVLWYSEHCQTSPTRLSPSRHQLTRGCAAFLTHSCRCFLHPKLSWSLPKSPRCRDQIIRKSWMLSWGHEQKCSWILDVRSRHQAREICMLCLEVSTPTIL